TPWTTAVSWFAFSQDEPHATHRVNEAVARVGVDLLPQPCHLHVDDIVERRRPARLFPHLARQHLARHQVPLMTEQVFEELELSGGQIEQPFTTHGAPG